MALGVWHWQIYVEPIRETKTTLVMVFDKHPSIGSIRLGVHRTQNAIRDALYRGVDS